MFGHSKSFVCFLVNLSLIMMDTLCDKCVQQGNLVLLKNIFAATPNFYLAPVLRVEPLRGVGAVWIKICLK